MTDPSYYNAIAAGYNELHGEEQLRKYRIIAHTLELAAHESVLDVGAGTGIGYAIIPSIGIDPAAELIKQHPHPASQVGGAELLPYPDASFDAVICVTAFHHTQAVRALAEMQRVTRGKLAISVLKKSPQAAHLCALLREHLPNVTEIDEAKDTIFCTLTARKA